MRWWRCKQLFDGHWMSGELSVGVGSVIHPTTPKVGHQSVGYFSPPDVCIGCSSHCTVAVPIWSHRNQVFIVALACNVNMDVKHAPFYCSMMLYVDTEKSMKTGTFWDFHVLLQMELHWDFDVSNIDPSNISAYPGGSFLVRWWGW